MKYFITDFNTSISGWYSYKLLLSNRVSSNHVSTINTPYFHSIRHWYGLGCPCQGTMAVVPSIQYGGGKSSANLSEIKNYITPYSLELQNATSVNYKYSLCLKLLRLSYVKTLNFLYVICLWNY